MNLLHTIYEHFESLDFDINPIQGSAMANAYSGSGEPEIDMNGSPYYFQNFTKTEEHAKSLFRSTDEKRVSVVKLSHEANESIVLVRKTMSLANTDGCRLKQITEEINFLRQLKGHPNIVQIYGSRTLNGQVEIFMEFLDMHIGEFRKRIKLLDSRARIDLLEISTGRIVVGMSDALDFLEKQSPPIIHGDIKLENIMITRDGRVVLIDFDSARYDQHHYGTGYTRSPTRSSNQVDHRDDVYSLGATLVAYVQGGIPTNANDLFTHDRDLLGSRTSHNPIMIRIPQELSEHFKNILCDFVTRCLDENIRPSFVLKQMPLYEQYNIEGEFLEKLNESGIFDEDFEIRCNRQVVEGIETPEEMQADGMSSMERYIRLPGSNTERHYLRSLAFILFISLPLFYTYSYVGYKQTGLERLWERNMTRFVMGSLYHDNSTLEWFVEDFVWHNSDATFAFVLIIFYFMGLASPKIMHQITCLILVAHGIIHLVLHKAVEEWVFHYEGKFPLEILEKYHWVIWTVLLERSMFNVCRIFTRNTVVIYICHLEHGALFLPFVLIFESALANCLIFLAGLIPDQTFLFHVIHYIMIGIICLTTSITFCPGVLDRCTLLYETNRANISKIIKRLFRFQRSSCHEDLPFAARLLISCFIYNVIFINYNIWEFYIVKDLRGIDEEQINLAKFVGGLVSLILPLIIRPILGMFLFGIFGIFSNIAIAILYEITANYVILIILFVTFILSTTATFSFYTLVPKLFFIEELGFAWSLTIFLHYLYIRLMIIMADHFAIGYMFILEAIMQTISTFLMFKFYDKINVRRNTLT